MGTCDRRSTGSWSVAARRSRTAATGSGLRTGETYIECPFDFTTQQGSTECYSVVLSVDCPGSRSSVPSPFPSFPELSDPTAAPGPPNTPMAAGTSDDARPDRVAACEAGVGLSGREWIHPRPPRGHQQVHRVLEDRLNPGRRPRRARAAVERPSAAVRLALTRPNDDRGRRPLRRSRGWRSRSARRRRAFECIAGPLRRRRRSRPACLRRSR